MAARLRTKRIKRERQKWGSGERKPEHKGLGVQVKGKQIQRVLQRLPFQFQGANGTSRLPNNSPPLPNAAGPGIVLVPRYDPHGQHEGLGCWSLVLGCPLRPSRSLFHLSTFSSLGLCSRRGGSLLGAILILSLLLLLLLLLAPHLLLHLQDDARELAEITKVLDVRQLQGVSQVYLHSLLPSWDVGISLEMGKKQGGCRAGRCIWLLQSSPYSTAVKLVTKDIRLCSSDSLRLPQTRMLDQMLQARLYLKRMKGSSSASTASALCQNHSLQRGRSSPAWHQQRAAAIWYLLP